MSEPAFRVRDLGRLSYGDALKEQEAIFNRILEAKRQGEPHDLNTLLLVEHDPVYTLGKSGDPANLVGDLKTVGAEFFRTSRGGDITYHGPGQIVGYPIFDLEQFDMGLAQYIWSIEEAIIQTIAGYDLKGERLDERNASGVWLDVGKPTARKICAIGVKASRYVTMHGFAFNVNTDLHYFTQIIPCGISDKGVTSMQQELGTSLDYEAVKRDVAQAFEQLFMMSATGSKPWT